MNTLPSAVNIMRLPDSQYNSSGQVEFAGKLGSMLGQGMLDKKVDGYTKDLLSEKTDDPKAKKEALVSSQIELQKEQQVQQATEQAEANHKVHDENSRLTRILEDPDSLKKLSFINKHDPASAKFVLDVLKTSDIQAKAALAEQSAQAQQFYGNLVAYGQQHGEDAAKDYARGYARELKATGAPVDKVVELLTKTGDDFFQAAEIQGMLAGNVAQLPEAISAKDQHDMLIKEEELRLKQRKQSFEENQAVGGRDLTLREQELQLDREKFEEGKGSLSATAEKTLIAAQESAQSSDVARGELLSLADEYEQIGTSGASARWTESIKEFSGKEDQVTSLRKRYNQLKNSQVMKSLPPGVASDKDIEIAMSGFLSSTASPAEVASFLRGMAKMESINYEYQSFKSAWLSDKGNTRGMLSAWEDEQSSKQVEQSSGGSDEELFNKYGI